jgi:carbon monoxide dehydrogenase subunit G
MGLDRETVGTVAMEAMDEMQEGGALHIEGGSLEAVAVIVAVGDGEETRVNYRLRDGAGHDLDEREAAALLAQVLANVLG